MKILNWESRANTFECKFSGFKHYSELKCKYEYKTLESITDMAILVAKRIIAKV